MAAPLSPLKIEKKVAPVSPLKGEKIKKADHKADKAESKLEVPELTIALRERKVTRKPAAETSCGKTVQHLYKVIQKSTGAVGGYGHNGPVYGEITMGTFQKIVDALREHTDFGPSSTFMDIGSGLGKPNLHVALNPGVRLSFGVELEELRWQLSMHNLRNVLREVSELKKSVVYFANSDATDMVHFEPFTHIYMFDVGFPPAVLVSLANAFNASKTVQALVSFIRPDKVISVYGFAVDLVCQIQTRMCGSTEQHNAYVYRAKPRGVSKTPRRQMQFDEKVLKQSTKGNKEAVAKDLSPLKKPAAAKELSPLKKASTPRKSGSVMSELGEEQYDQWLVKTGLLGAPGQRPSRNATRKLQ
jgi:SAM-dependent methyltransferase